MKAKMVGLQDLQFKNDRGENIVGKNVYILWEDENVVGLKAGKLFLKEGIEVPKDIKINDMVQLSFTMTGKVEAIYKA